MEKTDIEPILTTEEKIDKAVRLIRSVSAQHNCFIAFSSGKDSCVLEFLVKDGRVKADMIHNVTTIDPEGTISETKILIIPSETK